MRDASILVYCNADYFSGRFDFGERADQVCYDKSQIFSARCVVFHLPSLTELDYRSLPWLHSRKTRNQLWVIFSAESDANYPALAQPEFMKMFDLEMSYRQRADVWTPYLDVNADENLCDAPRTNKEHFAAAFISSSFDQSRRCDYLAELMKYMPVHSYGKVLNNATETNSGTEIGSDHNASKLSLIARHRYTIAFENSISPDYVTEKFYQPLRVGSIPIYLGAPNIDEFAPSSDCYVNVSDFSSPRALAEHLMRVSDEDYHAWREYPQSAALESKIQRLKKQGPTFDALYRLIRQLDGENST